MTTLLNEAVGGSPEGSPEGVLPGDSAGTDPAVLEAKRAEVKEFTDKVAAKEAAGTSKKKMKDDVKKLESRKKQLRELELVRPSP